MLELPQDYELIGFFECEPHVASKDVPWVYNSIAFETVRGDDKIYCRIEPDFGELHFSWLQCGTLRTNLKLKGLQSISVKMDKDDEFMIASTGPDKIGMLVKIRLKPTIAVELCSNHYG